jgi:hypothetical protein
MSSCAHLSLVNVHLKLHRLLCEDWGAVPLHAAKVGDFAEQILTAEAL